MSQLVVDPSDLAIVVIDVQPYFLEGWMVGEYEPLLVRLEFLFALATVYEVPCLATFEQPRAGCRSDWSRSSRHTGSVIPSRPLTAAGSR